MTTRWERARRYGYERGWLRCDYNIGGLRLTALVWPSDERGFLCAVRYDDGVALKEYAASEHEARAHIDAAIAARDPVDICAVAGCGEALSRIEAALPDRACADCLAARDRCLWRDCGIKRVSLSSRGWRCRFHAPEILARAREEREFALRRAKDNALIKTSPPAPAAR